MTPIQVIPAKKDDVPDIARIHATCWRDAYSFLPETVLTKRNEEFRKWQWQRWIAAPGKDERLFLIKSGTQNIGFCFAKPNSDRDAPRARGELHAGYVLREWRGSSAGPKLMKTMAQFLETRDRTPLVLWAFRQNPMRIWYGQLGWKRVVERYREIEGVAIPEFGYVSPPLEQLYDRLDAMIESCALRDAGLQRKRSYQLAHPPLPEDSDRVQETDSQTP